MFNKNVFTQKDPIADIIKGINEADYKAKMEELKGNQHKIDKNKNNKIDAHDFKILRGEKKAMKEEEEVEESNNPFDLKNYKSQLPTKPGEKAGFDSKKVSTGTIYSRKPVKDEPMKKEEIDPNDTTTDTLKGREKASANPFLSKKVKMDVPDNVKEDVEQIDEGSGPKEKQKTPYKDINSPEYRAAAEKQKQKMKDTTAAEPGKKMLSKMNKEDVDQIDELSKDTLKSYSAKAKKDSEEYKKAGYAYDSDPDERAFAPKAFKKAASRAAGAAKADSKIKEDVEQMDERTLTKGETAEKERIVKGMKKSLAGFKARYGDKAKSVMYATATKAAKKD